MIPCATRKIYKLFVDHKTASFVNGAYNTLTAHVVFGIILNCICWYESSFRTLNILTNLLVVICLRVRLNIHIFQTICQNRVRERERERTHESLLHSLVKHNYCTWIDGKLILMIFNKRYQLHSTHLLQTKATLSLGSSSCKLQFLCLLWKKSAQATPANSRRWTPRFFFIEMLGQPYLSFCSSLSLSLSLSLRCIIHFASWLCHTGWAVFSYPFYYSTITFLPLKYLHISWAHALILILEVSKFK